MHRSGAVGTSGRFLRVIANVMGAVLAEWFLAAPSMAAPEPARPEAPADPPRSRLPRPPRRAQAPAKRGAGLRQKPLAVDAVFLQQTSERPALPCRPGGRRR
jgi:hypothetical protein